VASTPSWKAWIVPFETSARYIPTSSDKRSTKSIQQASVTIIVLVVVAVILYSFFFVSIIRGNTVGRMTFFTRTSTSTSEVVFIRSVVENGKCYRYEYLVENLFTEQNRVKIGRPIVTKTGGRTFVFLIPAY
jgi:hypothetical protein